MKMKEATDLSAISLMSRDYAVETKKDKIKAEKKWHWLGYVVKGSVALGVETICVMSPLGKMATSGLKGIYKVFANAGVLGITSAAIDAVVTHVDKDLDDLAEVIADFIITKEEMKNESEDA